jgi:hypothetical protein
VTVELSDTWRCIWCEALLPNQDTDTCKDCDNGRRKLSHWKNGDGYSPIIRLTLFGVGYSPEYYHFTDPGDLVNWLTDRGGVVEVSVDYVE